MDYGRIEGGCAGQDLASLGQDGLGLIEVACGTAADRTADREQVRRLGDVHLFLVEDLGRLLQADADRVIPVVHGPLAEVELAVGLRGGLFGTADMILVLLGQVLGQAAALVGDRAVFAELVAEGVAPRPPPGQDEHAPNREHGDQRRGQQHKGERPVEPGREPLDPAEHHCRVYGHHRAEHGAPRRPLPLGRTDEPLIDVTGGLPPGTRFVAAAGGQADVGQFPRGMHCFPGFADGQPGYLGQLLVHEHEQDHETADVGDALGIGPVRIGHRPDQQEHLDQRQDYHDQPAARQARGPGVVLEVAARFPLGRRGQPRVVAGVDLTAGPGGPVRELDRLVDQVSAPFRRLLGGPRRVDGGQAVLFAGLVMCGCPVMEGLHRGLDDHGGRRARQDLHRRLIVARMAVGHRVLDDADGHGRGLRVAVDRVGFLEPLQVRVVQ